MKKKKRLVCGVGINDADYAVSKRTELNPINGVRRQRVDWLCPHYAEWVAMLKRCKRNTSYSVCKEWLLFSNYRAWSITQTWFGTLKVSGFVYSASNCSFTNPLDAINISK